MRQRPLLAYHHQTDNANRDPTASALAFYHLCLWALGCKGQNRLLRGIQPKGLGFGQVEAAVTKPPELESLV